MTPQAIKALTVANNELARQLAINSFTNQQAALADALKTIRYLAAKTLKEELYARKTG